MNNKFNYVYLNNYNVYIRIDTIEVISIYGDSDDFEFDKVGFISSESANYQYDVTKEELDRIEAFINLW